MVESYKNIIALGILGILPICGIFMLALAHSNSNKSRNLDHITDRYDAVHQSVDDFMSIIVNYLPNISSLTSKSLDKITSLHLIDRDYGQLIKDRLKELNKVFNLISADNPNSETRASAKNQIIYGSPANILKSITFWIIFIISFGPMTGLYLLARPSINPFIIGSVMFVGLLFLILSHRKYSQNLSLLKKTERYASLKVSLYDTRREFVRDTSVQLLGQHVQFIKDCQGLTNIPQSREFFNGLVMLSKLGKSLESIYRTSDMSETAPLFAVSIYLEKLIAKKYAVSCVQHNITLSSNVDKGLAFQIYPKDLEQLMDIVVANAIRYNKPDTKIVISGRYRHNSAIITVSDTGKGMDKDTLQFLFNPLHRPGLDLDTMPEPQLGLQIAKVIVARIGGELKVASKAGKGTVATIIAPRKQTQIKFDIPRHIIKSNGRIN